LRCGDSRGPSSQADSGELHRSAAKLSNVPADLSGAARRLRGGVSSFREL